MKLQIDNVDNTKYQDGGFQNQYVGVDELLVFATENEASDLFIKVGDRPYIMRFGKMIPLNVQPTTQVQFDEWFNKSITSEANAQYVRKKYYDTSYTVKGYRYRINFSYSEGQNILTARMITPEPPRFIEYGGKIKYPEIVKNGLKACMSNKRGGGMVIFASPTGSGKTTTMASCINSWGNDKGVLRDMEVLTLEDPIEYKYRSVGSFRIVQKEKGKDFLNYPDGITSAMREHPHMIIIGEMRDKETVHAASDAAKSGHICVCTYHTRNVATTISRLCDNFSGSLADALDLISNISMVVCQRLEPRTDQPGLDLFIEYCVFNYELKNRLIKALQTGSEALDVAIEDYLKFNSHRPEICGRIDPLKERMAANGGIH